MKVITIKIGSNILLNRRNKLDEYRINQLVKQILSLKQSGFGIVLVVSGAVACGAKYINVSSGKNIFRKAAAGIGQACLTAKFLVLFKQKNLQIAQILLRKIDIENEYLRKNLTNLLLMYLKLGIIPFINENDVLELNSFSGNDFLGGEITVLLNSDKYVILSTMKGSIFGIGGKTSKMKVKELLKEKGVETIILDGKVKNILLKSIL